MVRVLLVIAMIGLLPMLYDLGRRLWVNEPYRFFPLAWGIGLVTWGMRLAKMPATVRRTELGASAFLGVAVVLFAFSLRSWSPWTGGLGVLALMAAVSWLRAGWKAVNTLFPPLALLAVAFPPPLGLDTKLMLELKKVAVSVSSNLLDLLGIVHMRSGTVIELPTTQLMVEDACSGIQSFMAVAAFAALLFVLERRPWWHWVLLSLFAALVVIAMNVVRITFGAYVLVQNGWDLLHGTPHLIFGGVIFAVELLLVFSFDRFLAFFEVGVRWTSAGAVPAENRGQDAAGDAGATGVSLGMGRKRYATVMMAALTVFGMAAAARGVVHFRNLKPRPEVTSYGPSDFQELAFTLPKEVKGWTQGDTVPETRAIETSGLRTKIWVFTRGELKVLASIDYPFDHFHDLVDCYRTAGWETNVSGGVAALTEGRPPIAYLNLARRGFDRTEVWYTNCFSDGRWSELTLNTGDARRVTFWDRMFKKTSAAVLPDAGEMQFRSQVCWSGLAPLMEADRYAIRELYESISAELAVQVKTQLAKTK